MPAKPAPLLRDHLLLDSTDLDEVRELTGRLWGRHRSEILGRERYRLRFHHAAGQRLSASFVDCSARVRVRLEGACGGQLLVPLDGGVDIVADGVSGSAAPGLPLLVGPCGSLFMQAAAMRCLVIGLPPDQRTIPPGLRPLTQFHGPMATRLVTRSLRFARAFTGTGPVATPALSRAESDVCGALCGGRPVPDGGAACGGFPIGEATAWLEARAAGEASIARLAHHLGMSRRAVEQGFSRALGCSPAVFRRSLRLEWAHGLLTAGTTGTSVTGVALAVGFTHLARFAAQYRERYGEAPSDTLARARRVTRGSSSRSASAP
jgi:AraC-like DNA-binding protein